MAGYAAGDKFPLRSCHRPSGDKRQLPRNVRFLLVRVLCDLHLEVVLPGGREFASLMLTFMTFGAGFLIRR